MPSFASFSQAPGLSMNDFPAVLGSYFEGLKAHDVNKISLAVADDLAFVTPARTLTKQQFLGLLRALYTGFPDWHYEHGGPEIQQDEIAVLFRQGGYHTGPFGPPGSLPVKPTGRYVAIPEHYFFYKLAITKSPRFARNPWLVEHQWGFTSNLA